MGSTSTHSLPDFLLSDQSYQSHQFIDHQASANQPIKLTPGKLPGQSAVTDGLAVGSGGLSFWLNFPGLLRIH
jgi:hypothetical protein